MDRLCHYVFVSATWVATPLMKRRVVDYMSLADIQDGSPVATFAALFSVFCSVILVLMALPSPYATYMNKIPAEGWTMLGICAVATSGASMSLVNLLREGNPGLTVVYLNAMTCIMTYVCGSLLYGKLSADGMGGVLLITAGIVLTRTSDNDSV